MSLSRRHQLIVIAACLVIGCSGGASGVAFVYPQAHRSDVQDDYHGTLVEDPYRWLEDPESAETLAWVEAQNELSKSQLHKESWGPIEERLTQLWNYARWTVPFKEGGRVFYSRNDGLQNQDVWYMQETLDGEGSVVLDPNALSDDGTVAVTSVDVSRDGKLMALRISSGGSDWQQIRVLEVDTGVMREDLLDWCKFSSVAWHPDGTGFFYNRFPDPSTVAEEDRNRFNKVYWHALGTPQSEDALVYEEPEDGDLGFAPWITEDGRFLVLWVYRGTDPNNRIYYREVGSDGPFLKLLSQEDAMYVPLGNVDDLFYFHTDLDAPKGRIIAIDLDDPERESWKEIVPEHQDVVHHALMAGSKIVITYMHDAHDNLVVFDPVTNDRSEVELPGIVAISGLSGRQDDAEILFSYMSFLDPPSIMRHDLETGVTSVFREPTIEFDSSGFVTKQVFYESKDGTKVPMFITHAKGVELDGTNPTLLYGYGGFNISLTPRFRAHTLLWLENGGIFAVANLRGGNEYGEQWHQQGILDSKQNVFDDFIAAAEWLIDEGYTSTPRLAIMGGSNGGLLTAACMLQRPDLFGAVVSAVPVIDMLRYHKFSVGHFWVSDYGNAEESKEHFDFLYAYSPLHNIVEGTVYPPTLVTTADTDDRVVPMHGKKFVAALQAADAGVNPILLRVETKAGHGKGKPTSKRIEEMADIYSFLFLTLDMTMNVP